MPRSNVLPGVGGRGLRFHNGYDEQLWDQCNKDIPAELKGQARTDWALREYDVRNKALAGDEKTATEQEKQVALKDVERVAKDIVIDTLRAKTLDVMESFVENVEILRAEGFQHARHVETCQKEQRDATNYIEALVRSQAHQIKTELGAMIADLRRDVDALKGK